MNPKHMSDKLRNQFIADGYYFANNRERTYYVLGKRVLHRMLDFKNGHTGNIGEAIVGPLPDTNLDNIDPGAIDIGDVFMPLKNGVIEAENGRLKRDLERLTKEKVDIASALSSANIKTDALEVERRNLKAENGCLKRDLERLTQELTHAQAMAAAHKAVEGTVRAERNEAIEALRKVQEENTALQADANKARKEFMERLEPFISPEAALRMVETIMNYTPPSTPKPLPVAGEQIQAGSVVWTKSTGLGPFVILSEAVVEMGPPEALRVTEAYVCRSKVGADCLIPVHDVTLKRTWFPTLRFVFWVILYYMTFKRLGSGPGAVSRIRNIKMPPVTVEDIAGSPQVRNWPKKGSIRAGDDS